MWTDKQCGPALEPQVPIRNYARAGLCAIYKQRAITGGYPQLIPARFPVVMV